jgi:hypothetical protein
VKGTTVPDCTVEITFSDGVAVRWAVDDQAGANAAVAVVDVLGNPDTIRA